MGEEDISGGDTQTEMFRIQTHRKEKLGRRHV